MKLPCRVGDCVVSRVSYITSENSRIVYYETTVKYSGLFERKTFKHLNEATQWAESVSSPLSNRAYPASLADVEE